MDIREVRKSRLQLLCNNIEKYASELTLSSQEYDWAIDAYTAYCKLLEKQNEELRSKNEISKSSIESDTALFERYVVLKSLILSKLENNFELQEKYGINESIPYNRIEKYEKVKKFIECNDELVKQGDKFILPQLMVDNLRKLVNVSQEKYENLEKQRSKSVEVTNELNALHDEDSIKLRNLYNWVVAFWGKRDSKLLDLGFVPMKTIKLSNLIKNLEIDYKEKERKLSWNTVNGIDNYQVALRDNESTNNWIELHNDSTNHCTLNGFNGELTLRLRVKNKHGYSDWSSTFELNIEPKE